MGQKGRFSTKNLMSITGLNYRTITDWDLKGIVPAHRDTTSGWRRFTVEDLFVILVCTEMRDRFGIPISSLRWVKDRMFEDQYAYLAKTLQFMKTFGVPVFILTDLRTSFRVCTPIEMIDSHLGGFFDRADASGFVLLKVNALVNKLLEVMNVPPFPEHGLGYQILWHVLGKGIDQEQTPKERELLEAVRDKTLSKIEVKLNNGSIVQTSPEKRLSDVTPEELIAALNRADFQTLKIVKHDGRIVEATQRLTGKIEKTHQRGASKRRNNPS